MADNLTVFGTDYTGVMGIKAKGTNNGTLTYIRPFGTKTISVNGTNIDVSEYESVDVNVTVGVSPTGNIDITHSGVTDVTNYATATVPEARQFAAINSSYLTQDNMRKWQVSSSTIVDPEEGGQAGWLDEGIYSGITNTFNAVPTNTTVTPSTSSQTIGGTNYMMEGPVTVAAMPSGTAGTPTATKGSVSNHAVSVTPSVTNTTGYITGGTKTGTAVTVSASELVSGSETKTANGTYDVTNLAQLVVDVQGGSTPGVQVATATAYTGANQYLGFINLAGEPTSFVVMSTDNIATSSTPIVAAVVYDGNDLIGQTITNTSNAQVSYNDSVFSIHYSDYDDGLYVYVSEQSNIMFGSNLTSYVLVYTYNGTASSIQTKDVQVGSGATSITFTGLEDEPEYFSCLFKSNFSTSSGYQRVIGVVYDGTDIYGLEMDSSAKYSDVHWTYSYNNGSLTITSSGTNAGGYFHQPGYYQLTYAYGGASEESGNYQSKTVTPTTSTQEITADSQYDALEKVTVNPIPSQYIVPTGTVNITSSGTTNVTNYASASVATGSATASATKGTVSSHSITVTPSVTRTAGYITAGSSNGTAVTVSASELVSGSETKTVNGTYDVTNLASVIVNVTQDVFVVTVSKDQNNAWIPDKTYDEIAAASSSGKLITVKCNVGSGDASADGEFTNGRFIYWVREFSGTEEIETGYSYSSNSNVAVERYIYIPSSSIVTYYTSSSDPTSSQGNNGDIWLVMS